MIGLFDESNVMWAALPKCYQNGQNPDPYSGGNFPIYRGPASKGFIPYEDNIIGPSPSIPNMSINTLYDNGDLVFNGVDAIMNIKEYYTNSLQEFTMLAWFRTSFIGAGNTFLDLFSNAVGFSGHRPIRFGLFNADFLSLPTTPLIFWPDVWSGTTLDPTRESRTGRLPWNVPDYNDPQYQFNSGRLVCLAFTASVSEGGMKVFFDGQQGVEGVNLHIDDGFTNPDWTLGVGPSRSFGSGYRWPGILGASVSSPDFTNFERFFEGQIETIIAFDKTIDLTEFQQIYSLGPDLLGLQSFDNGDGTKSLQIENRSSAATRSSFRRPIQVTEYEDNTFDRGRAVQGSPKALFEIYGSCQPLGESDTRFVPDGMRDRAAFRIYSDYQLKTYTEGDNGKPDTVELFGETYETVANTPWQNDVINHYKNIVVKV